MESIQRRWTGLIVGILSMAMILLFGTSITAHAAGTLVVNGVDILSVGTIKCGNGTATFDATTNTLTLHDATIDQVNDDGVAIAVDGMDLTIKVEGSNTINAADGYFGIYNPTGALTIKGNSSQDILDITVRQEYGAAGVIVNADSKNLSVNNVTLRVTVAVTYNDPYVCAAINCGGKNSAINIDNADVTVSATGTNGIGIGTLGDLNIHKSTVNSVAETAPISTDHEINIEDSTIVARETSKDPGSAITTRSGNITIKGDSDVTADGGIIPGDTRTKLIVIPAEGQQVEYKGGNSKGDAQHVDGSPFGEQFSYSGGGTVPELRYDYIHIGRSTDQPDPVEPSQPAEPSQGDHRPCHHRYEWEVTKKATATDDGVMKYRCKYCGKVEYEVPISAYYVFNKDTQEAILKAEQGATVTAQTPLFISFHEMVKNALQERPDVTLVVDYKNAGKLYEMTIPAGSGDQLEALFGESQFAGFLYLGGAYATTELPADTQFTNIPAELMWFGTTNAH